MHQAILEACLPCLGALAVSCAALGLVVRLSGARWDVRRLRALHRCQEGGVQSLAFVLTLPIFLMIVLFIVQVSQLMIGTIVVHYAAFASARAASVWIPAEWPSRLEAANQFNLSPAVLQDDPAAGVFLVPNPAAGSDLVQNQAEAAGTSPKFAQVRRAAVLACAPVGPSRELGISPGRVDPVTATAAIVTRQMYAALAPGSRARPERIDRKIAYSDLNTFVFVEWRDSNGPNGRDTWRGPTYNPHPVSPRYDEMVMLDPGAAWRPNEVGWQDPVTVRVVHRFALLPGPGRLLARFLVRADGLPDTVSERIQREPEGTYAEPVFTTPIAASVTITNEGLKSVRPYVY